MDILFCIILLVGLVMGIKSGAVGQFVSFTAFLLGLVVACRYYDPLSDVLSTMVSAPALCKVVAFILLWVAIPILAKLVGASVTSLLDKLWSLGLVNRAIGGLLGLLKYALVLGSVIWLFSVVGVLSKEAMQKSRLAGPLKTVPELVYKMIADAREE